MPKIIINGKEIEFEKGMTVLQACELANVEIPTFPALSKKNSDILRKPSHAIKPRATGVKNYTMKDLRKNETKS